MEEPLSRASSSEPRFDRQTLVALADGLAVAAIEAKAGRTLSLPSGTGSWELPGHDLAATRLGGQIAGTHVEWRAELRGGVAGTPAIVDGKVFAASIGGAIASLDLATGHVRWRRLSSCVASSSSDQARVRSCRPHVDV
jgi:outer membrane protein assembly factor BamB